GTNGLAGVARFESRRISHSDLHRRWFGRRHIRRIGRGRFNNRLWLVQSDGCLSDGSRKRWLGPRYIGLTEIVIEHRAWLRCPGELLFAGERGNADVRV